jgi:hypothetical protein
MGIDELAAGACNSLRFVTALNGRITEDRTDQQS